MSTHALGSAIRHAAEQAASRYSQTRIGIITSYDPTSYSAKVRIQPEGIETGWLPLMPQWCGNGWGMFAPPPQGAQVVVAFQEGHPDCGIVLGALASDVDRPLPVPNGEAWMQHESGAGFRLTNDGGAIYQGSKGQALTLGADGSATLTNGVGASVRLVGDLVFIGGDAAGDGVFAPIQTTAGPSSRVQAAV